MEELTDDYRQHLLDLCEATDLTNDFAAWKLAQEAKTAIPLLVAELRRLRELCDDNGIETEEPVPLERQPCGCEVRRGFWELCDKHSAMDYCPEVHYPDGEVRHVDETGFCYRSSSPIPKDVQDRVDEVFERRRREGTW